MSQPSDIEGFEVPIHQSLTQPILVVGVPRSFAIANFSLSAALTLGLGVWWLGIPIGFALHVVAAALTRHDPLWFEVIRRHVRHESYLEA